MDGISKLSSSSHASNICDTDPVRRQIAAGPVYDSAQNEPRVRRINSAVSNRFGDPRFDGALQM